MFVIDDDPTLSLLGDLDNTLFLGLTESLDARAENCLGELLGVSL